MKYKVRCSSIGAIMTDPRTKAEKEAGILSKTAQGVCVDMYAQSLGRYQNFTNKYTDKGQQCEDDSIMLLNDVNGLFVIKNDQNYSNEYLTGTPDGIDGGIVHDVKTNWSLETFMKLKIDGYGAGYEWQLRGYMALTKCEQAQLHYCLVNATPELIDKEKKRIAYQFGFDPGEQTHEYLALCRQVERNMIFDMDEFQAKHGWYDLDSKDWHTSWNIPKDKRIVTYAFEQDTEAIEQVYKRVEQANTFIENTLAL